MILPHIHVFALPCIQVHSRTRCVPAVPPRTGSSVIPAAARYRSPALQCRGRSAEGALRRRCCRAVAPPSMQICARLARSTLGSGATAGLEPGSEPPGRAGPRAVRAPSRASGSGRAGGAPPLAGTLARFALPYGRRAPAAANRPYLGVAWLLNERMARAALLTP